MPYFTHDDIDKLSHIEELKPENWKNITEEEDRIRVLQECSNIISEHEGRPRTEIMWAADAKSPREVQGRETERGWGGCFNPNDKNIYISTSILNDESPYRSINALCHEAHHAYQDHALNNEGFHENKIELAEWKEGLENRQTPQQYIRKGCTDEQAIRLYKEQGHERSAYLVGDSCARHLEETHEQQRSIHQAKQEVEDRKVTLLDCYQPKEGEVVGRFHIQVVEHHTLHGFETLEEARKMPLEEKRAIENEIKEDYRNLRAPAQGQEHREAFQEEKKQQKQSHGY